MLRSKEVRIGSKRKVSQRFDFYSRGLKNGDIINFIGNDSITAIVTSERHVLFENDQWLLSPLVRELFSRMGNVNSSGAYQGPAYFTFKGVKLTELSVE